MKQISRDSDILSSLFDILECQKIIEGDSELVLMPEQSQNSLLAQFLAVKTENEKIEKNKSPHLPTGY
jgi:hypothetical protein